MSGAAAGSDGVIADRELLKRASEQGRTLSAYVKLSGPGWLQSAITLGGGSLAGSLFLGALGGVSMLWLQLVAIVMGVVMLSAISYVTLSTGRRPLEAINSDINPALGWGWLIATSMANMIWCMPQFSLCYDALDRNLSTLGGGNGLGDSTFARWTVTIAILIASVFVTLLKVREGQAARWFDRFLKSLIGLIVVCFFGVTLILLIDGQIDMGLVMAGFVPDFSQWTRPAGEFRSVVDAMPPLASEYWSTKLVANQRTVMIAAAATAVGINMTFLLPYSMLARGWDKPFRGLARFDLATGMAIPFVIVTSCIVVAAAASFHNRIDEELLADDLATMRRSPLFVFVAPELIDRVEFELRTQIDQAPAEVSEEEKLQRVSRLAPAEKRIAAALVKRDAFQLSQTLSPLLGEANAKLVFGLGVFGMGFSSIIILMLINGYVFREMIGQADSTSAFVSGVIVVGISGASWTWLWAGGAKIWLAIFASTFGMMLLPIAYVTFFLMMNSRRMLGDEMPRGIRRWGWNLAMGLSVAGAITAATTAIVDKAYDQEHPMAFPIVVGILVVYAMLVVLGFWSRGDTLSNGNVS